MLPKVCSSSEIYGEIELLGNIVPICGIAGDQQAAMFGQCAFNKGDMKNTYGTGCFLLANTGHDRVDSKSGLLTTIAATCKNQPVSYALEGSVFVGGAVVQWLRDEMKLIHEASDSEYFASKVPDSAGVYIVPAFAGLGAPHWDMYARGSIFGLTRGSGKNHIIRAALESIAYQTNDVIKAVQNDMGMTVSFLSADGGASANNLLMQFQADISNIPVHRPASAEATAKGAAFLAGLACGFYEDTNELMNSCRNGSVFMPKMDQSTRSRLTEGWDRAVKRSLSWEKQ